MSTEHKTFKEMISMAAKLAGKVAVVTGASKGIGGGNRQATRGRGCIRRR